MSDLTDQDDLRLLARTGQVVIRAERLHALLDEAERLQGDLERAHEELRQGWPKMTYEANSAAIEAMNERDEARAEVERLQAQLAAAKCTRLHVGERPLSYPVSIPTEDDDVPGRQETP